MNITITRKNGNSGFSLIEALVAGIIVVITGTVILTLFNAFSFQSREGTRRVKMQIAYDIVSEDIGKWIRNSRWALAPAEDTTQKYSTATTTRTIRCVNRFGTDTVSFSMAGGTGGLDTLLEKKAGNAMAPFKAGSNLVFVTPSSNFTLSPNRKTVKLNLVLVAESGTSLDTIIVPIKEFLCRN